MPTDNAHLIEQLRVAWECGDAPRAEALLLRLHELLPMLYAAQATSTDLQVETPTGCHAK